MIVQRDLLGAIAEYTTALEADGQRWPMASHDTRAEADRYAREAMRTRHAAAIAYEDAAHAA